MNYLVLALAFAGLVGCFDIATRMSLRTRHSIRMAVIVIGLGCGLAMLNEYEWALVAVLAGCGLYRLFDMRSEGWRARTHSGGVRAVATEPNQFAGCADEFTAEVRHAVGGGMPVQADRQNHDVKVAA